jgi:hypothetical protein
MDRAGLRVQSVCWVLGNTILVRRLQHVRLGGVGRRGYEKIAAHAKGRDEVGSSFPRRCDMQGWLYA